MGDDYPYTLFDQRNRYINVSSNALTREEKRMAKDPLMADKLKNRKTGAGASRHRKDGRLPGGM